jgi:ubiquinone/menaquinone biosynthesis C-methylase UbiE
MNGQSTKKRDLPYLYKVYRQMERTNRQQTLQLVERRPHGRLLDCGCGDGEFTVRLANRARVAEAYGIESADERIAEASDRGVIVTKADLNDPLPYRDHFFDIIHAGQVIEHVRSADLFLAEAWRVLHPDGYAVLTTNNLASWHNIVSLAFGLQPTPTLICNEAAAANVFDPLQGSRHPYPDDTEVRVYSYQGLRELCSRHGFRVEATRTVGYYPLPSSLARLMCQIDSTHGAFLIVRLRPGRP